MEYNVYTNNIKAKEQVRSQISEAFRFSDHIQMKESKQIFQDQILKCYKGNEKPIEHLNVYFDSAYV